MEVILFWNIWKLNPVLFLLGDNAWINFGGFEYSKIASNLV